MHSYDYTSNVIFLIIFLVEPMQPTNRSINRLFGLKFLTDAQPYSAHDVNSDPLRRKEARVSHTALDVLLMYLYPAFLINRPLLRMKIMPFSPHTAT